jgi:DNA-binding PadR family transcriptional regulator
MRWRAGAGRAGVFADWTLLLVAPGIPMPGMPPGRDAPQPGVRRIAELARQGLRLAGVVSIVGSGYKGDTMPVPVFLGEFEQFVLLAALKLGNAATALELRKEMAVIARRPVSRGALYRTLDRLDTKGYVRWKLEPGGETRGGQPSRRFTVTARGVAMLKASRKTLEGLWTSVERALG